MSNKIFIEIDIARQSLDLFMGHTHRSYLYRPLSMDLVNLWEVNVLREAGMLLRK